MTRKSPAELQPLKPCPFCGSVTVKLKPFSSVQDRYIYYGVICQNCDSRSGTYDSELAAKIAWNNRP